MRPHKVEEKGNSKIKRIKFTMQVQVSKFGNDKPFTLVTLIFAQFMITFESFQNNLKSKSDS